MALKGTTKIELINVKTGEREVIEKDNLVTNAVASALDNPFAWQLRSYYSSSYFAGNMLPLCPNLFGGILLYEDAIPEDENQLYAQAANKLIGYSSNNVNNKTDVMRGSMNQTESGELEDGTGYRFVFDFSTSQANGTISAVGLTSKWGGIAGNGSLEWKNVQCPAVYYNGSTYISDPEGCYSILTIVHYDPDTGIGTAVYVPGQNMIAVKRVRLHTKEWRLTKSMLPADYTQIIDAQILETETFAGVVTTKRMFHVFCDGGDGYIWGFEHSGGADGNSSGNATINWVKIKIDDLSIEEGTWEVNAQLRRLGIRIDPVSTTRTYTNIVNATILDGYLYCLNYSLTGMYKINLKNVTDVTFIEHPNKVVYETWSDASWGGGETQPYYCLCNITVFGNRVCLWNGWLNGDTIQPNPASAAITNIADAGLFDGWLGSTPNHYPYRHLIGMYNLKMGVFSLGFSIYPQGGNRVYSTILLDPTYLATINNLATPVEKTADKTMKITYILREE